MRKKFEKDVRDKYDVDIMGHAHWYLQSRITQHTNYDVTIDQSRYIALMCNRFMPNIGVENITERELLKYAALLPTEFVASKEDASENYMQVKELEEEFGFEYASLIGMLIYLMNTAFVLHFPITKLARFMALPGRTHFKAAKHLLNFLRCHHHQLGLTYYTDVKKSPIYELIKENSDVNPESPLILLHTHHGRIVLTLVEALEDTYCTTKEESLMEHLLYQILLQCQLLKQNTTHLRMQCKQS